MENEQHKTSSDVKTGLQIEADTKPHIPIAKGDDDLLDKEIDADDLVHEQEKSPTQEEDEKDMDDEVHSIPQPVADTDEERDPDDMVHGK